MKHLLERDDLHGPLLEEQDLEKPFVSTKEEKGQSGQQVGRYPLKFVNFKMMRTILSVMVVFTNHAWEHHL